MSEDDVENFLSKIPDEAAGSIRAKMLFALEIVERFHGKEEATKAMEDWIYEYVNKKPLEIPEKTIWHHEESIKLKNLLKECGLVGSTSDGLRMIKQKAVKIDDVLIEEDIEIPRDGKYRVCQVGKKKFMRIRVSESRGYA